MKFWSGGRQCDIPGWTEYASIVLDIVCGTTLLRIEVSRL